MRKSDLHSAGLYLLAAIVITWPLLTVFSTHLLGHPFGDSYEYTRHIWWTTHALQTGQPIFDQPLLAYPDGLNGAWLWGNSLQSFPAWLFAFILPLPAAFNLAALLTLALNGWSMHFLAERLTGSRPAAFIAGLVFMAYPHFQGQLGAGHTGLLVLWPVPLYVWALLRATHVSNTRFVILTAGLFVMSLWGNQLLIVYLVGPVTALVLLLALWRRDWHGLARMCLALGIGGAVALAFFWPVVQDSLAAPRWLAEEHGDVTFSADLLGLVTPSFQHPLYSSLDHTHTILGVDPFERVAYVGIIAGALALIGVLRVRAARPWLLLALLVGLLSLGPLLKILDQVVVLRLGDYDTGIALPWIILQKLPLLSITRTPARFHFTMAFAVAVMAGYGVAALVRATQVSPLRINLGVGVIALLILFDYQFFWPFPTIPGTVPEPIAALRGDDSVRAVLDVPWAHLLAGKDGLFLQTGHHRPLIGGHVTRRTPVDPAKLTLLQDTLDPALLDAAGVDVVIVHKSWDEGGTVQANTRARLGEPFYDDERISAYRVPPAETEAAFIWTAASPLAVTDTAEIYIYAPQPGWAVWQADTSPRPFRLLVDGSAADTAFPATLPLTTSGYHTITVELEPPCPRPFSPALTCDTLHITALQAADFMPTPPFEPVTLAHGITLAAAQTVAQADTLTVRLWWHFAQPLQAGDTRFIHVLNEHGELVLQDDRPLTDAGGGRVDVHSFALAGLPPGAYRVTTGWYRYPDTTPFETSTGGPIEPGTFTVD